MAFFRSVSALSRLRSRVGQQSNLANSVRWLQTPSSSNTDLYSELKELVPEYQERVKKLKKDHGSVELGKIHGRMLMRTVECY
uniref:Uncharacterized protein n=1 Tax=Glycine max TaxID=3847 RepID=C6TH65_SOYBN|nr:unknown [Glycine max]